ALQPPPQLRLSAARVVVPPRVKTDQRLRAPACLRWSPNNRANSAILNSVPQRICRTSTRLRMNQLEAAFVPCQSWTARVLRQAECGATERHLQPKVLYVLPHSLVAEPIGFSPYFVSLSKPVVGKLFDCS